MEKKRKYLLLMLFLFIPHILTSGPPEILPADSIYRVQIGGSVCMPCKVEKQYTNPLKKVLFYWSKDNSPIGNWPRYRNKENRCLRIRLLEPSDAGEYICHAINTHGKTSVKRRLIVVGGGKRKNRTKLPSIKEVTPSSRQHVQPSFPVPSFLIDHLNTKTPLIELALIIGQKGKLKCAVDGTPPPVITWFKDGVVVLNSPGFSIRKKAMMLVIRNFQENYVGTYTCVAENSANKVNMSFIVTAVHEPNNFKPPMPITENLYVKPGMNVSLSCNSPASKVKLMQWHVPKQVPRVPVERPSKDASRLPFVNPMVEKPTIINSSRFKTFNLYNVSQTTHEGKYKCMVLYKNSREPFTVKIVNLIFQAADDTEPNPRSGSQADQSTLILFIGIPVFAGVLSMVLAVICIRCYRYHKKRVFREVTITEKSNKLPVTDDDDTLSMQILPAHFPTNSLRSTHKTFQNIDEVNISRSNSQRAQSEKAPLIDDTNTSNDIKSNRGDNESHSGKLCNLSQRSLNSASKNSDSDRNNHDPGKQEMWPGEKLQPGDSDYIDFKEDEILFRKDSISLQKSSTDTLSEHRTARKARKTTSSLDSVDSHKSFTTPSTCSRERLSPISNLPEEEDLILQQEIKNWQPLIRNSARLKESQQRSNPLI